MKPSLQLVPRAPAQPELPPDYLETTASLDEMAAALSISMDAARARAKRGRWILWKDAPSEKQSGKTATRVFIKNLSPTEKRRLRRYRRRVQREEQNLAPHPGGLVCRPDDGRVKATEKIKQTIWSLFGRREQPGAKWVFQQLRDKCPFCEKGKMHLTRRGHDAEYKSARCDACQRTLSYTTVRRICEAMPPLLRVASREGINAAANKHFYHGRIQRGEFRNAIVVGDHHVCDIFLWDERRPWLSSGEPDLKRRWLSAWQDEATGVAEFALGTRPNTRLILDALFRYAIRWKMPCALRTDNGKDYLSKEFMQFWRGSGIEQHHKTLPSCRTGESHGKSKVIERWFGTFERDVVKFLPGWCGSHPKERPEDVLWPQYQQHREFLDGKREKSPFLSVQQFERKVREWLDGVYHRRETKRLNSSPAAAFAAGTAPLRELSRDALAVLMLHPESRVVGRTGVSVNGLSYWTSEFVHHKGEACEVRIDFDDISSVVCIVGKERRVLTAAVDDASVAAAGEIGAATEENRRLVHQRKKAERQLARDFFEMQREKMSGRRPWDVILEEKAAEAGEQKQAVNGAFTPTIPIVAEAHQIARKLLRATKHQPVERRISEPPKKPIFATEWEKEEWEREHPEEAGNG